jgi:hypothetical protein
MISSFLSPASAASGIQSSAASIDRGTGRSWVEHELSKKEYAENDLTPLEQIGRWISDLWDSLIRSALGANSPWLLVLVMLVLAAIIALIVWRVRRVGLRRTGVPLSAFDPVVSLPEPGPWRESAARAARAGNYKAAVIDQSRAIFAVLSVKQIVSLESSATATEIARDAEAALPEHAGAVGEVAEVFNDLLFGDENDDEASESANSRHDLQSFYADLCTLDQRLETLPSDRSRHPAGTDHESPADPSPVDTAGRRQEASA